MTTIFFCEVWTYAIRGTKSISKSGSISIFEVYNILKTSTLWSQKKHFFLNRVSENSKNNFFGLWVSKSVLRQKTHFKTELKNLNVLRTWLQTWKFDFDVKRPFLGLFLGVKIRKTRKIRALQALQNYHKKNIRCRRIY